MKLTALLFSLFPAVILAVVGGRCSNDNAGPGCICLHRSTCKQYGAYAIEAGYPNDYPCPYDASDVVGCYFNNCGGPNVINHYCEWSDGCVKYKGKVLPNPTCPGPNNYVCCQF